MIADYLDQLSRELDFDRSLSRWRAAGSRRSSVGSRRRRSGGNAARGASSAPSRISAMPEPSRRSSPWFRLPGAAGAPASLRFSSSPASIVAMKARVVWYAAVQWAFGDDMRAVRAWCVAIDRYAFLAGDPGRARRLDLYPQPRDSRRRSIRSIAGSFAASFCYAALAAAALVVSVVSDGVLTALQLRGTGLSAELAFPILSMAIEVACVGILVFHIRGVTLRAASTAALSEDVR